MSVIDKNMYENLKNWCDRKRPENQFLMYVNMNDRELTNATIRKLMFEEDKQDVEGELYIAFYSAENFYRNMRDYFSHVGGMYFREPGEDDPIEDIIKDLPPTCGWITLIVEDMDALSGQNDKLQEMMRAFSAFAAKRASVILVGKGNHEDVFAGCEYALDKMAAGLEAKEEDNLLMIGCYDQEVSPRKKKWFMKRWKNKVMIWSFIGTPFMISLRRITLSMVILRRFSGRHWSILFRG